MKRTRFYLMSLLAVIVLLSTQRAWAAGIADSEVQAVKVGFGDSLLIPELGIEITFRDVVEDSRCPAGAACFWEGAVEVELLVGGKDSPGLETVRLRLDRRQPDANRATLASGDKIELLQVDPYPDIKEPISLKDYSVTLVVEAGPEITPLPVVGFRTQ